MDAGAVLAVDREAVTELDRAWAAHAGFGDGAAIERRSLRRLRVGLLTLGRRVPRLATVVPPIAADDRALLAVLGDPVLRNAFELDRQAIAARRPHAATALAAFLPTVDLSANGPCQRLAQPPRSAWPADGPAWAWTSVDEATGPIAARLCALARRLRPTGDAPLTPTEPELAALRRGAGLLTGLLPGTGGTALRHVRMVAISRRGSLAGDDRLPGALLVAASRLATAQDTARIILREGSRLALLEVDRCRPLASTGSLAHAPSPATRVAGTAARVAGTAAPALLALHRCLHLALFAAATGSGGQHARLSRAHHLAAALAPAAAGQLTPHGRHVLAWLTHLLAELDALAAAALPPGGAHPPHPHASLPPFA